MMVISSELQLAIACCRAAYAGGGPDQGIANIDWPRFLRLVRFHRVQGLVWKGLGNLSERVPGDIRGALFEDARRIATANLLAAVECQRLNDAFARASTPLLFLKGLPLAMLAYGGIEAKAGIDIDLLVPEDRLLAATSLLRENFYRPADPAVKDVEEWHSAGKESSWVHQDYGHLVDLHSRTADHRSLIPGIDARSKPQSVEVAPGIALPTLQREELFAYLCVHGASSAWFRLKWIADLAALLHREEIAQVENLYRRSQELHAGRAAGQALLVADALFGSLADNRKLSAQLKRDRATRWLAAAALKQLAGRDDPIEPTSRLLGTARIHMTQLALLPGWRFAISEGVRQVRAALR